MLNQKNISDLNAILTNVETQGDLESLYNALEPLKIGVPYWTECRDKKVDWIWGHANTYKKEQLETEAKQKIWNQSRGNFATFKTLANDFFAENGSKEQRILELIGDLYDRNWCYLGKGIEDKYLNKGYQLKPTTSESQMIMIINGTETPKLRGFGNNWSKIEQLILLVCGENISIPVFNERTVRTKNIEWYKTENYEIFLNGNVKILSTSFKEGLKPYLKKYIENTWHTVLYKF